MAILTVACGGVHRDGVAGLAAAADVGLLIDNTTYIP